MHSKTLVAACLCLAAGPVLAGGPVVVASEPPVVAPVAAAAPGYDWTGFYAGVSGVFGTVNGGGADLDTQGFGAQAGYLRDLGRFVLGGELSYSTADINDVPDSSISATRLKLIGGLDAGRVLPYVFVGLSDMKIKDEGLTLSDNGTNYGIGARLALGAEGRVVLGLEYLVEKKDDFGGTPSGVDNREFSLRIDYRF